MAVIRIQEENRVLDEPENIRAFLAPHGIQYDHWPVAGRMGDQASAEEILEAYAPEIEQLKSRGGYVTADVIDVTPEVPNLQAMLDRFNKEHTHAEDEVRFIVKGSGLFHIHPEGANVFSIEVQEGDLINVPAGTRHWFDLCPARAIRAIRLFREKAGWTPEYTESGIASSYEPLCLGLSYLQGNQRRIEAAISLA